MATSGLLMYRQFILILWSERRLNVLYRNQYFVARALGNLLGLARLHRFVADAAELVKGPFTTIASHAQLDYSSGEASDLLAPCGPPPAIGRRRVGVAAS